MFYALTNLNSDSKIYRLDLSDSLSEQLGQLFEKQLVAFEENTEVVPFSVESHEFTDKETIFSIDDQSIRDPFDKATKAIDSCGVLDVASVQLSSICSLFYKDKNENLLFQYFDSKRKITNEVFTLYSFTLQSNEFKRLDGGGFILDDSLVACFKGNLLQFKKFHLAKRIFDLSGHFREATEEEVIEFGKSEIFAPIDEKILTQLATPSLRSKIFEIRTSGVLSKTDPKDIQAFAQLTLGLSLQLDEKGLHI